MAHKAMISIACVVVCIMLQHGLEKGLGLAVLCLAVMQAHVGMYYIYCRIDCLPICAAKGGKVVRQVYGDDGTTMAMEYMGPKDSDATSVQYGAGLRALEEDTQLIFFNLKATYAFQCATVLCHASATCGTH